MRNIVFCKRLWPACVLLVCLGCGIDEYEKRMEEQKKLLAKFDEESKYLSEPLQVPMITYKDAEGNSAEKMAVKADFFLLPPKGTQSTVKDTDKQPFTFDKVALFRYPGQPGYNVLIAINPVKGASDKEAKGDELSAPEFQHEVRGALREFYRTEYRRDIGWPNPEDTVQAAQSLTDNPGNVTDPKLLATFSIFTIYFRQQGNDQAAIIYQFPASNEKDAATLKSNDLSIKSLGLGVDAANKRQEYNKRRGR